MLRADPVEEFQAKRALLNELEKLTLEKYKAVPYDVLKALHRFISKFKNNMPEAIRNKLKEKIELFVENSIGKDKVEYLALLVTMVTERTRPVSQALESYEKLHKEFPNFLRAYNYHAEFLFKQKRHEECIAFLTSFLARTDIKNKKRLEQASAVLNNSKNALAEIARAQEESRRREEAKALRRLEQKKIAEEKTKQAEIAKKNKESSTLLLRTPSRRSSHISNKDKARRRKEAQKRHAREKFIAEQEKREAEEKAKCEAEAARIHKWNESKRSQALALKNAEIVRQHYNRFGMLSSAPQKEPIAVGEANTANRFRKR